MTHPTSEEWMAYLYGECDAPVRAGLTTHLHQCSECRAQVETWRAVLCDLEGLRPPVAKTSSGGALLWRVAGLGVAAMLLFAVGFGIGRLTEPPAPPLDTDALKREIQAAVTASLDRTIQQKVRHEVGGQLTPALAQADGRILEHVDKRIPSVVRTELTTRLDTAVLPTVQTKLAAAKTELRSEYEHEMKRWTVYALNEVDARTKAVFDEFADVYRAARAEDRLAMVKVLQEIEAKRQADYSTLQENLNFVAMLTGDQLQRARGEIAQLVAQSPPSVRPKNSERNQE